MNVIDQVMTVMFFRAMALIEEILMTWQASLIPA